MSADSLISIVAPLESDSPDAVEAFVEETVAVLSGLVSHHEIILVDDGAPDATVARVRALLERHDFLRFLRLSRHFGEETAITAGLDVAIGDYVVVMLPSMDPPALIPEFLERARGDTDVVYGVRLHRKNEPFWYRAGARLFYWYMNSVVRLGIPRDSTQFRCMSRQAVNALTQIRGPDQYLRMLTSYIGFRKEPVPYAPINRSGAASVRPKSDALDLARARIIDSTTHPLRVVVWTGVGVATLNLLFVTLHSAAGDIAGAAFHEAVVFLVIALMLLAIAEYIGSMSQRMRARPTYYVREEHTSSVLLREERRNVVEQSSE
jgi:glycosyltransferase involved in cell wall biosynthesis